MDLARTILLRIEAEPKPDSWIEVKVDGRSSEEVSYHVKLLAEAGLIEAHDLTTRGGFDWRPSQLTWAGHEFLDAARSEGRWAKAKKFMVEKAGSITFEAMKDLLLAWMKSEVLPGGTP